MALPAAQSPFSRQCRHYSAWENCGGDDGCYALSGDGRARRCCAQTWAVAQTVLSVKRAGSASVVQSRLFPQATCSESVRALCSIHFRVKLNLFNVLQLWGTLGHSSIYGVGPLHL